MQVSLSEPATPAAPAVLPPTSLIICSRNRRELLCDLVDSVLRGHEVPAEIVIVDDSDELNVTLQTLETTRACDIRYLWTRSRGLSRANNDGIAAARNDILVFTQDDVLVSAVWFGAIVRALLKAGPGSIVTGRVPPEENGNPAHFAPSTISDAQPRIYSGRVGEGIVYVQNMAMYRAVNTVVGGFDERLGPGTPYPSAEDNDFMYRALKAGYRVVYCPDAVVYHRAWRGKDNLLPLRWNYGLGRGAMYAKNTTRRDRFTLGKMAWDIRVHVLGALTRLRHERLRAFGDLALAFGIVCGALRWWVEQRR